jgi:hypothetical protein
MKFWFEIEFDSSETATEKNKGRRENLKYLYIPTFFL